jgi:hypothetical protein
MAKQPRKPADTVAPPQTPAPDGATPITPPAPSGAPDAAAAMAAQVTGADQAPPPVADAPPAQATGDQVADPAQKADNGPTPPETGIAGKAAGEGATGSGPAPASPPELDLSAHGPDYVQVTVIGPAKGRWRAGRHFTPEATVIRGNELTGLQAKALDADPELVCVWAEVTD